MSLTDVKVEISFNVPGFGAGPFILDNSSFGILGSSALSDFEFLDVTQYVMSLQTNRGRSRQLDNFNAGSASVVFNNIGREFDPLNVSSPFYPGIKPRGFLRITAKSIPVFYGVINDWDIDYSIVNNDVAVAVCSEPFSILANQLLTAFTPSAQLSGARVDTVLNRTEVNYIGGRDISTGSSTLGAYAVPADTNVLNYLRQIERSEAGRLYVSSSGNIIFKGRGEQGNIEGLLFSDDGLGIPYQTLKNEFGDEMLYNYVRCTSPAGAEQIKSDTKSIELYQISQLSFDNLLNSSTTEVASIALIYLSQFKEPNPRLTGFSVQLRSLSDFDMESVLNLDLTDWVDVKKTFASGSPASITQTSFISGVSHQVTPDSHIVNFNIEQTEGTYFLILGDDPLGALDSGMLDFG
jgi:hypothetical protein